MGRSRYLRFRHHDHRSLMNAFVRRLLSSYHVPLFVAIGSVLTTTLTEIQRKCWNAVPRNLDPSYNFKAYAYNTQQPRRFLFEWSAVQERRKKFASKMPRSYKKTTTDANFFQESFLQRNGNLQKCSNNLLFRSFSTLNDEMEGEESWESVNENDDDSNDDLVTDTFIADLENNDDDDYDDVINGLEEGTMDYNSYGKTSGGGIVRDDDSATTSTTSNIDDPLIGEYERWLTAVNKAIAALEKKQFSLEKEFTKAEQLESLQTRGQYLQSYRHMFSNKVNTVTVQDWDTGEDIILTLETTKYNSIGDEIDAIFSETKKLKRGKKVVGTLLNQTIKAIDSMKEMKQDLDGVLQQQSDVAINTDTVSSKMINSNMLQFVQDRLLASAQVTNFKPPRSSTDVDDLIDNNENNRKKLSSHVVAKPVLGTPSSNIRKLISPAGCTILVGRNRRGNEYISLNLAKKDDIWMHARDIPGAHVLIVQRRGCGTYATEDCYQLAANLAAFYSDGRSERTVLVSAAEPKHIQKPRGAPLGAVKLREELRVYNGYPDMVPNDLKEARAISGLSNEYRIQDKSKLRKQNKQQVLELKKNTKRKIKEKVEQQKEADADKFY